MWLVLPRPFSLSALAMAGSTSPLDSVYHALERSATSSGKSRLRRYWQLAWRKVPYMRLLSGLTCEPSMAAVCAEGFLLSQPVIHANPSRWQESEQELLMSDICGHKFPASFGRCRLPWCSSKTSPDISASASKKSVSPYRSWVTRLRQDSLQRRKSVRRIAGSASSCWRTPRVADDNCDRVTTQTLIRESQRPNHQVTLPMQARLWPTARATDGSKGGLNQRGSSGDLMLPSAAVQWPTPAARDWRDGRASEETLDRNSRPLNEVAVSMWQTPNTTQHEMRRQPGTITRNEELLPAQAVRVGSAHPSFLPDLPTSTPGVVSRPRLNPVFVEGLMGVPQGWTDCGRSVMVSYPSKLPQPSELLQEGLLNGDVKTTSRDRSPSVSALRNVVPSTDKTESGVVASSQVLLSSMRSSRESSGSEVLRDMQGANRSSSAPRNETQEVLLSPMLRSQPRHQHGDYEIPKHETSRKEAGETSADHGGEVGAPLTAGRDCSSPGRQQAEQRSPESRSDDEKRALKNAHARKQTCLPFLIWRLHMRSVLLRLGF